MQILAQGADGSLHIVTETSSTAVNVPIATSCARWSHRNQYVCVGATDGTINYFKLNPTSKEISLRSEDGQIDDTTTALCLTSGFRFAISGHRSGALSLWDFKERRRMLSFTGHESMAVKGLDIADKRLVVSGSSQGLLLVHALELNLPIGALSRPATVRSSALSSLSSIVDTCFQPSSTNVIASADDEGYLCVWDLTRASLPQPLAELSTKRSSFAVSAAAYSHIREASIASLLSSTNSSSSLVACAWLGSVGQ